MKSVTEKTTISTTATQTSQKSFLGNTNGEDFFGRTEQGTPPIIQSKLIVNTPGDTYEQEADHVADQVMRMKNNDAPFFSPSLGTHQSIQLKCDACAHEEKEKVKRKETGNNTTSQAAPPIVSEVISSGGGRPLDADTKDFMESRMGQDFSQVRVHTDARAAESAVAIQAKAYTSGQNVVFGAGEYQPGSEGGKRLLAHELVHTMQQNTKVVKRQHSHASKSFPPTSLGSVELVIFEFGDEFGAVKMSIEKDQPALKDGTVKEEEIKLVKFEPKLFTNSGFLKQYSIKAAEYEQELFEIEKGIALKAELSFLEAEIKPDETDIDLASITFQMKGTIDAENIDITTPGKLIRTYMPDIYPLIKENGLKVSLSGEVKVAFTVEDLKTLKELREARKQTAQLRKEAEALNKEMKEAQQKLDDFEAEKKKIGSQADDLKKEQQRLTNSKSEIELERKKLEGQKLRSNGRKTEAGKRLEKIEKQIEALEKSIKKNDKIARKLHGKLTKVNASIKKAGKRLAALGAKMEKLGLRVKVLRETSEKLGKKLSGKFARLIGSKVVLAIGKTLSVIGILFEIYEIVAAALKIAYNFDHLDWIWNGGIPLDEIPIERVEGKDIEEGDKVAESMDDLGFVGNATVKSDDIKEGDEVANSMDDLEGNAPSTDKKADRSNSDAQSILIIPLSGVPPQDGGGDRVKELTQEPRTVLGPGMLDGKTPQGGVGTIEGSKEKSNHSGSDTNQPTGQLEPTTPGAGNSQARTLTEQNSSGSGDAGSGTNQPTGELEPTGLDAGGGQTKEQPASGEGTIMDSNGKEPRQDIYFPLGTSSFSREIFNMLAARDGFVKPTTENEVQRFVDLVHPYIEFITIEEVQAAFQAKKVPPKDLSYNEWLKLVEASLEELKKKGGSQGSIETPQSGQGGQDKKLEEKKGSGGDGQEHGQSDSDTKVIIDKPDYSGEIPKGKTVSGTRYLYFPKGVTFSSLKIDQKHNITMAVTTDAASYSVLEPFEITIKDINIEKRKVTFEVVTPFRLDKANSIYPANTPFSGKFK